MSMADVVIAVGSFIMGGRAIKNHLDDVRVRRRPRGGVADATAPAGTDAPIRTTTHRVRSIDERMKYVIQMIKKGRDDGRVRKLTTELLSRKCGSTWCIPERDWEKEVLAIFRAVRERVRYTRDTHGKDLFQHPSRTLEFGAGDCDDFVIVLASMLLTVGYPVKLRVIRTKGSPEWNHIYLLVGLPPRDPARWMTLDASVPRPAGWEPPRSMIAAHRDFEVT